jgi:hypothetical protein
MSRSKILTTIAAAGAVVALAACGSTTTSPTTTAVIKATPVAAPVQTAEQAGTGFYNTSTLDASVKSTYNTTPPITSQASAASCVTDGQSATCLLTLTDGTKINQNLTIDTAGDQWITTGQ